VGGKDIRTVPRARALLGAVLVLAVWGGNGCKYGWDANGDVFCGGDGTCNCWGPGDCRIDCGTSTNEHAARCDLGCVVGNCDFTCGETCSIDCSGQSCSVDAPVRGGILCYGVGACDVTCGVQCGVSCDLGAACLLRCEPGGDCEMTRCQDEAQDYFAPTICADGVQVCNRECPESSGLMSSNPSNLENYCTKAIACGLSTAASVADCIAQKEAAYVSTNPQCVEEQRTFDVCLAATSECMRLPAGTPGTPTFQLGLGCDAAQNDALLCAVLGPQ
jgi:hypothetical protein